MFSDFLLGEEVKWYSPPTMRWRKGKIVAKWRYAVIILTKPEKWKIEVKISNPEHIKHI